MRNHQQRNSASLDEFSQAREDLRLDDDVECRGRFVGNDDVGIAGKRHCDHDPLLLSAGKFVRICLGDLGVEVNLFQQAHHTRFALSFGLPFVFDVQVERFEDLLAHCAHWIERMQGALEDDRGF